jgi:glycosyltransferase involved in cell wall biosynthesis
MPAYNASDYIKDAINSVINQTLTEWELIIIDDGSTDNTSELVKEFLLKDNRIHYFYQQNGKQGKARNLGISKANGEYLAFLDADDLWLPEKLKIQYEEIHKNNVDLVFSNSYVVNHDADNILKKMNVGFANYEGEIALKLFLQENRIPILTVLVKKETVMNVGAFSEKLEIQNVEDYHLWLKLLLTDCVFYSSNCILAKYRLHSDSATANDSKALNKIPAAFFDLLENYPNYKSQIRQELKQKFKLFYKSNLFTKQELIIWIKINIQYLSKSKINYFYLLLNLFLPTKITKRMLIYILNA